MMARRGSILTLLALCLSACFPAVVQGRGLLGERYVDALIGVTKPGNDVVERYDDSIVLFGGDLNWPVNPNVDLQINVSHEELDGSVSDTWLGYGDLEVETTVVVAGANFHFHPGQKVDPFLIMRFGLAHGSFEEDTDPGPGSESDDDTGPAVVFGAGIQFDAGADLAVRPSLVYKRVDLFDDTADDVALGADVSLWFTKRVFGLLGFEVGFDEGDVTFFAGAGLGF